MKYQDTPRAIDPTRVVDADDLAMAFDIVARWTPSHDTGSNPFEAPDIFSVLSQIKLKISNEPVTVVALFKRSMALLTLCAHVQFPAESFAGWRPGRGLLVAASRSTVFEIREAGGDPTDCFDVLDFLRVYRAALN